MKIKIFFLVVLFIVTSNLIAQTALNLRVNTQLYDKGYNIMPAYKLSGNKLEYYSDTYAGEQLEKFSVVMPDLTGCTDTGYAFVYFGGMERGVCKNYSVIIIGNAQSILIPKLFIDKNHNLNYTDDGASIDFPYNVASIEFDLCNERETTACLHYKISRYKLDNQYTLRKNLDDFFTSNSGTKKYLGMHNSFRIQCSNQWGADVKIENDSFRIVVEDHNINGIYNEVGVDHINLVPYGTTQVSNDVNEGSIIQTKQTKGITLNHLGNRYLVSGITTNGQTLKIVFDEKYIRPAQNLLNKRAPRFSYELLAYRKYKKLRSYRGTPVYLYFYNFQTLDSAGFDRLKLLHDSTKGAVKIITLNYGNNPKMVKEFVMEKYYLWSNGLATKKIYEKYKVDQLPMGFYLNKRLRIVKVDLSPEELLKTLKK